MRSSQYVTELASDERYHFTTSEAQARLGGTLPAVRGALRRLKQKHEIADPARGFHVIVPPEFRRLECLPAEQFIPPLMEHLGEPYYVALLSAAEMYGASKHRPPFFQVMLKENRRRLVCGKVEVEFVARRDLEKTPVLERTTTRGTIRVSSPEATALEIVGYAERCGGLGNVAAVLSDMGDAIRSTKLLAAARLCPMVWVQRLGYLLEGAGRDHLSKRLVRYVERKATVLAPLVRARTMRGAPKNGRWGLAVNASVPGIAGSQ